MGRIQFRSQRSSGILPDTCRSPAISSQEIAGESTAFGGQMIQPVGSAFPLRLAAEAAPPSSSILSNRSRFRPWTPKTPGDGRHSPDGAGRHLAKLVEGLAALLAAGEPRPNALDPGFHGART